MKLRDKQMLSMSVNQTCTERSDISFELSVEGKSRVARDDKIVWLHFESTLNHLEMTLCRGKFVRVISRATKQDDRFHRCLFANINAFATAGIMSKY